MAVHPLKALIAIPLVLLGIAALAGDGDGVNLRITNDGIVDIYVTVQDMNTKPRAAVMAHQRINGFVSVPISVTPDAGGLANISWTAVSVDNQDRRCGHGVRSGLNDGATVNVHADSECAGN
jgi:hypothetical protein